MVSWITNDPEAAKTLRAIDRRYEREKTKCADWPLELKINRDRKLKEERQAAYDRVMAWARQITH